jgi:tetratricopeptide (TPR) repeat protein/CHAT domain-containing protein
MVAQRTPGRGGGSQRDFDAAYARINALDTAGRHADAIPVAEQLVQFAEAEFGPNHSNTALALHRLGLLYAQQTHYSDAEPLYQRALTIAEAALGPKHTTVALILGSLGDAYLYQARYAEAEPLLMRALEIAETLGPKHPYLTACLNNLASLYDYQGRYAEAARLQERALAINEKMRGAQNADLVSELNNLAVTYENQGRYRDAEALHKRALAIGEKTLGHNHPQVARSLENLAGLYDRLGQGAEAELLTKRALAIREGALGPDHPDVAHSLRGLAGRYQNQGHYAEAEPLRKRALSIVEKTFGVNNPNVAAELSNLATLYKDQGRYAEAEPLLRRALAISETLGPNHPQVATQLNNLAVLCLEQGRYTEAEQLYKRALAIREAGLGAEHPDVTSILGGLGEFFKAQGRYAEAEPLFKRALAIEEKAFGGESHHTATALNNLGLLYHLQNREGESEALLKRALSIDEKTLGPDHPSLAKDLSNLAFLYDDQGRHADAEPLHKRALGIREKVLGPNHPDVAYSLNGLALAHNAQRRFADAEPLFKRALGILEAGLPGVHPTIALALNNLAALYDEQKQFAEAEPLHKRALTIYEQVLPEDHPSIALSLTNLASNYREQGRLADAEPLYRRALGIYEKVIPTSSFARAGVLTGLAQAFSARNDWSNALDYSRRATDLLIQNRTRQGRSGGGAGEVANDSWFFQFLVRAAWYASRSDPRLAPGLNVEAFQMAQWARQNQAAGALSRMAARVGSGTSALSQLVRERQDFEEQRRATDKLLINILGIPPQERKGADDRAKARLQEIDTRLAAIDSRLKTEFPDFVGLASPQPLSIDEVRKLLDRNEALVSFLDTGEETFVWAVTREGFAWQRAVVPSNEMSDKVAALRRGLEVDDLKAALEKRSGALFDLELARALYSILLGPVEAVVKDKKQLIIVPSGVLTSLPFHLLVTEPHTAGSSSSNEIERYREAAWLIKRYAVTVLPSVPSLKALRIAATGSQASKIMVGFGDPVYGKPNAKTSGGQIASGKLITNTRAYTSYWQGTRADLNALREGLRPLPETADELNKVARGVGAPLTDVHLGREASETFIKGLDLSPYRIIYFATHGLIAGELQTLTEPALALSLPPEPTEIDDGLLTASEIAQLKLNADWVVLSACNTAAGEKPGAEALSGLARAFFYAGARGLLVSHWRVDSEAAVRLTTGTFEALRKDPSIGRAEALRRSMLAYMKDPSNPWSAYPDYWGPFSIVGEGGR